MNVAFLRFSLKGRPDQTTNENYYVLAENNEMFLSKLNPSATCGSFLRVKFNSGLRLLLWGASS
jgi:hypothetical protein